MAGIVTIWEHENFNGNRGDSDGKVWSTNQSVSAIPEWMNDRVSSCRVRPGYRAEFYADYQFQNLLFTLSASPWQLAALPSWDVNDRVTAIRILDPAGNMLRERNAFGDPEWPDNRGTDAPDDHQGQQPPRREPREPRR